MLIRKKLLWPAPSKINSDFRVDARPHNPSPVYQYEFSHAFANPFGVIIDKSRLIRKIIYDEQIIGWTGEVRLVASSLIKKKIYHEGPLLVVGHPVWRNYYHFTLELLPRIFMLKEHIDLDPRTRIILPSGLQSFHGDWLDLLGLRRKVVELEHAALATSSKLITCDYQASSTNFNSPMMKEYKKWIEDRISRCESNNFIEPSIPQGEKIFLTRRNDGRRSISTIADVEGELKARGYSVVFFDELSLWSQIKIIRSTKYLISIHGAAMANIIFGNQNRLRILELCNHAFNFHFYEKLAKSLDIEYNRLGCIPVVSTHDNPNHQDIYVNTCSLMALMDRLGF